jgi:hypothetical protein
MKNIRDLLGVIGLGVFVMFLVVLSCSSFWHYDQWLWRVSRHVSASQEGYLGLWIGIFSGAGAIFFGRCTWDKAKKMVKHARRER